MKSRIKRDDKVKIIAGKDNGKIGRVLRVDRKQGRVTVENLNMVKRHTKPNLQNAQGGIIDKEAPMDISNVMLVCNACLQPVRIKMKYLEDGKKIRVCRKCNEAIDA
ncbi:MAG: 50S ribosomal protein L24 [Deltaproteobacteria bacterium]|nr:MAG: 50S ribosomal protein L24 [Deltaproteobacteria bacterium]